MNMKLQPAANTVKKKLELEILRQPKHLLFFKLKQLVIVLEYSLA